MKREELFEMDTLAVRITVRDKLPDGSLGAATDLTGAALSCAIGPPDIAGVAGIATSVNLVGGVVDVAFPAVGSISSSYVVAQLRATRGGEVQTVWSQAYDLKPSIRAS